MNEYRIQSGISPWPILLIIVMIVTLSVPGVSGDNYTQPPNPAPDLRVPSSDAFPTLSEPQIPYIASDEEAFTHPYRDGAVLVRFDPTSDSRAGRTHTPIRATVIQDYEAEGIPGLQLVAIPDLMSVDEAVAYYQGQPGVLYAEPDYYRFSERVPSDPDFWRQWGLLNTGQVYREEVQPGAAGADIRASAAWDTVTGGQSLIAVLDSGVDYLHPDLTPNIWTDPNTSTYGYDAITGDLEPMDLASHGTHCAGIIGAVGDNGLGIAGVNWNTRILPVRFLNSFGTGTISDEVESILWATKQGAKIISCSYGGSSFSQTEYDVMKKSDALFICAAGNEGVDTDAEPRFPASLDLPNIISVAATDASDSLASFSNYGQRTVDLGAPGVDIYSTKHNVYDPVPVWVDPFDSIQNWTLHGNWTLDRGQYVSPNSSARAQVNGSQTAQTRMPAILTLNTPLKVSGMANPVLSYQWSLVATNYSFMIEGSDNGLTWYPLEYGEGAFMLTPFMKRECKIPVDLREGHLFLRFTLDGEYGILGLDDVMLSDGYGTLNQTRYGYMNGTSMAGPQISGMAGILAAAAPDASIGDIRNAILSTTDPLPSLAGKTVTGGRANLEAALKKITGGSAYHLRLAPGWNHVAVPHRLIAGNDTAEEVFGSLTNVSGHSLYRYDGGDWISVGPDEQIAPLRSYWVFTGSQASVPLMVDPDQTGFFYRNLTTGWNGFGILGEEPGEAKNILAPLSDIWSYAIGFNATTQTSDEPIIRGGGEKQNDTRPLWPYQGYWIYMIRNGSYEKNESYEMGIIPEPAPLWPQPLR